MTRESPRPSRTSVRLHSWRPPPSSQSVELARKKKTQFGESPMPTSNAFGFRLRNKRGRSGGERLSPRLSLSRARARYFRPILEDRSSFPTKNIFFLELVYRLLPLRLFPTPRAARGSSRSKVEKEIRAFARFPNKFLRCISRCIFI